jgi:hypothetical protein
MCAPGFSMMSLRYYSIVHQQDGSYDGVGASPAERLFRLDQGGAHERFVAVSSHAVGE